MNEPLRPRTLGEVLDRTAQMYRERFMVFFGIALLPTAVLLAALAIVAAVFALLGLGGASNDNSGVTQVVAVLVILVLTLLALPLYIGSMALGWAALCHAAARSFLGETITIREAYSAVWRRGWSYVGLCLFLALFIGVIPMSALMGSSMVLGLLSALLAGTGGSDTASAMIGIAIFVLIAGIAVGVAWILLRLCLAFPASVFEKVSPWNALKRSSSLSLGTRGRILVLFLLGIALGWAVSLALAVPAVIVISLLPSLQGPQHASAAGTASILVFYGLGFAAQALTRPVYGIALTLFYFDQRMRKEGFDIEWMMALAGMVTPSTPTLVDIPWTGAIPTTTPMMSPAPASAPESAPPGSPATEASPPVPGEAT
jgi:hypothetical protein